MEVRKRAKKTRKQVHRLQSSRYLVRGEHSSFVFLTSLVPYIGEFRANQAKRIDWGCNDLVLKVELGNEGKELWNFVIVVACET
jgi:hypothetical protein